MRDILSIDLETFSDIDIKSQGVYKYAENSEILLFAYALNDGPVQVADFTAGQSLPEDILGMLFSPDIMKSAYNASFEMHVINHWLASRADAHGADPPRMDPAQWLCTMVQGYTLGLPGGLEAIGKALHMEEGKRKLATGKALIRYFCKPCKPTKANGMRTRNRPEDAPEKWADFIEYNRQDVESERAIRKRIEKFFPNDTERRLWCLDQKINDAGVLLDERLVHAAIHLDEAVKQKAMQEARRLSGMDNPNSNAQLLDWFEEQEGWRPETLDKNARTDILSGKTGVSELTRSVIEQKNLLSKTSVKKYEAMRGAKCADGRVHGMLQFYGASRTGRWAGRIVQTQNLPQNHLRDLDDARKLAKTADLDLLEIFYDNPSDVLSQLIRTAFIAPEGCRFIVADFSAIEARVVAWLADEEWRMKSFAEGKDIYCESASQMFHKPVVKHGINGELRAKGKIAELACGYGGGVNALNAFGAEKMGIPAEDAAQIIRQWRQASPHIVAMWGEMERAAKQAIRSPGVLIKLKHGVGFQKESGLLFLTLPSGRRIAYARPRITREDRDGREKESITYEGATPSGGWGRVYTWGGKLVENLVQATARDCLAEAMLKLDARGYKIVMHVHDEVILEMPYGKGSLKDATAIMGEPIPWAPGLLLRADGYETEYYKKD